jgi:isoamylase
MSSEEHRWEIRGAQPGQDGLQKGETGMTPQPAASTPADRGRAYPLGATVHPGLGVNFSVYAKHCTAVELLFFNTAEGSGPDRIIRLDPKTHRDYHYWHVIVPGIAAGQIYGYRVHGPLEPERGLRFDPQKLLLDPYGKAVVVPAAYNRRAASLPGDNTAVAMKSVVTDCSAYDWQGDAPLKHAYSRTIIYELHVRGFTRDPGSNVSSGKRGTYAGLVEKIPYLRDLGITAVELLPVYQFDEQDAPAGMRNYWGYSPVSFFAPHAAYSSRPDPLGPLDEFRDMVKALHAAEIEVILDVVYNHTAEGNEGGPTICFRGFNNDTFYLLEGEKGRYANYSGCGNTVDASNTVVRRMIIDSLRHWVTEMHVDGFRFDLASILARDENGAPLSNPAILWDIESDPVLAGTKLIAEAWDASGLYQVGTFIGDSWNEWNGRFRDDARGFFRGDRGMISRLASRLLASPDLYAHEGREAEQSVNFVTCHDGFTMNDLVTYNDKHNESNGEENRDGSNDNVSWNCGVEGPTDDPVTEGLRNRQVKNFLAVTLLALGTPMLLMGDEVRRTQRGIITPIVRTMRSAGSTGHSSRSTKTCTGLFRN